MTAVIDRQQLFDALSDQEEHTRKHVHQFTNHTYFGLVNDGLKDGAGECAIGKEEYFAGMFVGGLRNHCGAQQWSSGDAFHGFYHADKRNGWGIYSLKNGEVSFCFSAWIVLCVLHRGNDVKVCITVRTFTIFCFTPF